MKKTFRKEKKVKIILIKKLRQNLKFCSYQKYSVPQQMSIQAQQQELGD